MTGQEMTVQEMADQEMADQEMADQEMTHQLTGLAQPEIMDQAAFSRPVLEWFAAQARDLPWRKTYDPYQVWISEIMLQQTQIDQVIGYFQRWMQAFPHVRALAAASQDQVFSLWEGLGYYNRARNLHRAANVVADQLGGELPRDHASWLALPGVGPYTAAAVCAIAYNQPHAVVDANVERVFARVFDLDRPVRQRATAAFIREHALRLTPADQARQFSQALMELGALVCQPRRPRCSACPLHDICEARRLDIVLERPIPAKAVKYIPIAVATGVLMAQGLIYIQKRPATGVWAGLWEFPGGTIEGPETPQQALVREYMEETGFAVQALQKLAVIQHGYTKYRVTLHCFSCGLPENRPGPPPVLTAAQKYRWVRPEELAGLAFPAGHRKLIDRFFR